MSTVWQLHPLSGLLLVSAALSAGASYAWRTDGTPGARYLFAVTGCSTL